MLLRKIVVPGKKIYLIFQNFYKDIKHSLFCIVETTMGNTGSTSTLETFEIAIIGVVLAVVVATVVCLLCVYWRSKSRYGEGWCCPGCFGSGRRKFSWDGSLPRKNYVDPNPPFQGAYGHGLTTNYMRNAPLALPYGGNREHAKRQHISLANQLAKRQHISFVNQLVPAHTARTAIAMPPRLATPLTAITSTLVTCPLWRSETCPKTGHLTATQMIGT